MILLVAAGLRVVAIDRIPPQVHPDESANIWNAWCLLNTGRDLFGVPWPVYYMRSLGENRSTLFAYLLIPVQAVFGLEVVPCRLVSSTIGVLTVWLVHLLGRKLFEPAVGLTAAGLLAILPWDITFGRRAHEGGATAFLTMVPVLAMVFSGAIAARTRNGDGSKRVHRSWAGLVAALGGGLAAGVACYGYPAVRIVAPVILVLSIAACWRWARPARIVALVAGFLLAFVPLATAHLREGESINKRAGRTWLARPGAPVSETLELIAARYVMHFGREFLFDHGPTFDPMWTARHGVVPVVFAVLVPLGAIFCLRRAGELSGARIALIWLLCYPLADSLMFHPGAHLFRAGPGIGIAVLLAALGFWSVTSLLIRRRLLAMTLTWTICVVASISVDFAGFAADTFRDQTRDDDGVQAFQVELASACRELQPRLAEIGRLFVTGDDVDMPYVTTAVCLKYDPKEWMDGPREVDTSGQWDRYHRYGRVEFLFRRTAVEALESLRASGWHGQAVFIVRAGETPWTDPTWVCPYKGVSGRMYIFEFEL